MPQRIVSGEQQMSPASARSRRETSAGLAPFARRLLFVTLITLLPAPYAAGQNTESLSVRVVGGAFSYTAQRGDSLTRIGARFGVDIGVLAAENNLSPRSLLKAGQALRIDNRHIAPNFLGDGIVINIPQRMLFHFKEGRLIRHFPVGLGRPDWRTPTGEFKIVEKREDPTWYVPPSIQEEMRRAGSPVKTCVPPGPDNPLGRHWLGLSISGYGIHGTIAPASIYQFQTHGCIRAHPDDVAALFGEVSRGTPVTLVYRRLMIAKVGPQVFLEAHGDVYKKQPDVEEELGTRLRSSNLDSMVDHRLARDIIRKPEGIARDITKELEFEIRHEGPRKLSERESSIRRGK
jgi:L,D-transpeptidase ErfK/SrfK